MKEKLYDEGFEFKNKFEIKTTKEKLWKKKWKNWNKKPKSIKKNTYKIEKGCRKNKTNFIKIKKTF